MRARVTAILVAQNGAERLSRTLAALHAQTRQPESLVVVDLASTDSSLALLTEAQPTGIVSSSTRLSFGTAVSHALGVVPPPADDDEWLWLLSHDSAPEPDALAALLAAVEVNPSVAIAGPKQMEWEHPAFIASFGEAVTQYGSTFPLVERELDQAQHDRLSDVLGVGAAGMLVRHSVWKALGGFDPALPTADNGLDLSIRARLAGHRVIAVPAARVAVAGDGLSGPGTSITGSARRRRQSTRRAAQLHRRLVYAPGFAVALHWLSLVPLAIFRTLFQVLRKQPGAVVGEFAAAFRTAFSGHVGASRRSIRSTKTVSWSAIAPLRIPGPEVRRRNALQRELALSRVRGAREELHFFSSGGATVVLAALAAGFALFFPLFGANALSGGSFLPLSGTAGELWAHVGYGWRDLGLGFVGASDPFAYLLAILGSLTFWAPSVALVALYLLAFPLAALAAWFCAAKITSRPRLRVFAAVLWVLAPPFLSALDAGQLGAVIAHLLLPWLVLAALSAARSWSASAITALLFAGVAASAPSLWPALLVLWLGAVIFSRRAVARYIGVPLPALLLALPLAIAQFMAGTPLAFFADPGRPSAHAPASVGDLLLGLPEGGLGGWADLTSTLGFTSSTVGLLSAILIAPLVLMAIAALFLRSSLRASVAFLIAVVGFASAFAATFLALTSSESAAVTVWAGSGLSLYWIGLVGAATIGLGGLRRFSALPAAVAAVAALAVAVLVVPVAASGLIGTSEVRASNGATLPAFVTAEAAGNPRVGTLVVTPLPDGSLAASVVHGAGATLDTQSTFAASRGSATADTERLSTLVGNLASRSATDASGELASLGVEFIVLSPVSGGASTSSSSSSSTSLSSSATATATADAQAVLSRATSAFDGNASLTPIGQTFAGELWQITGTPGFSALPAPSPTNTGTGMGLLLLIVQAVVFGLMLLLALPAGRLEAHGLRAATTVDEVAEAELPDDDDPAGLPVADPETVASAEAGAEATATAQAGTSARAPAQPNIEAQAGTGEEAPAETRTDRAPEVRSEHRAPAEHSAPGEHGAPADETHHIPERTTAEADRGN